MLRITTLVENRPGHHHGLRNEHGLSFYVEKNGTKFLFDTGQSDAFLHNASQMGLDLSTLDFVLLSHGHYDHSGGFRHLAERAHVPHLFVGPGFFDEKYAHEEGSYEYLGNNFNESYLQNKGLAWTVVSEDIMELASGVFVLANFPKDPETPPNPRFVVRRNGLFQVDPFTDEILIVLETPDGLLVILGCSHPGVRGMLEAVKQRLKRPISALLGGTHFVETKGRTLESSLNYLRSLEIKVLGLSHCTGKEALGHLAEDASYSNNTTGSTLFFS